MDAPKNDEVLFHSPTGMRLREPFFSHFENNYITDAEDSSVLVLWSLFLNNLAMNERLAKIKSLLILFEDNKSNDAQLFSIKKSRFYSSGSL
jgi:hypothetical protein